MRRALQRIVDALDRFEAAIIGCARAVGTAFFEGLIAYGFALHGCAPDQVGRKEDLPVDPEEELVLTVFSLDGTRIDIYRNPTVAAPRPGSRLASAPELRRSHRRSAGAQPPQ
jgi:hypothetical protein